MPVASVPALNTALLPLVHWIVDAVPAELVVQFLSELLVDQVADGDEPAPAVAPLVSQ